MRIEMYMRGVFRNFENYHYQVENGLLDRGVYEGYHNTLVDVLGNPFFREWWPAQRSSYGPAFRAMVDRVLDERREAGTVWKRLAEGENG